MQGRSSRVIIFTRSGNKAWLKKLKLSRNMSMNTLSVLWFVKSGPDASHLCDVSNFETLRDAKAFAEDLPATPAGLKRPHEIWRNEYHDYKRFGNTVHAKKVAYWR